MEIENPHQVHHGSGDNVGRDKIIGNHIHIYNNPDVHFQMSYDSLLSHLRSEFSTLTMMGFSQTLDIEHIFITLTVSPENITGDKFSVDTKGFTVDASISELYQNRDKGSPYRLSMNTPIPLHSILTLNKSVVLGEPGSGKTTLLKHLLIDITKQLVCGGSIPLFIKLADISSYDVGCINSFLKAKYQEYYPLIQNAFVSGNVVLFLDGFDEIGPREQNLIADEVSRLSAQKNKVCISCRTAVFPRNVLSSDFQIFECAGFSIAQRRKFIANWFSKNPDLSQKIQNEIFGNPNMFGLSRNPQLLSLMALLFKSTPRFTLPKKRIDLYLGSINVLINKREVVDAKMLDPVLRMTLLEVLAFYMSEHNIESVNRQQLVDIICKWKNANIMIGEDITVQIPEVIRYLQNCGVINSTSSARGGDQVFQFLHLTLQESLTASYILKRGEAISYITNNLGIPGKEEIVRLIMSQLDKSQAALVIRFFDQYSTTVRNKSRFYITIGRYLSDLTIVNHPFIQRVFDAMIHLLIYPSSNLDRTELTISLASLCSANAMYTRYFIEQVEPQMRNLSILAAYIDILKLSPSNVSSSQMIRMLNEYGEISDLSHETKTQIIGILIDALQFTYDESLWQQLYIRYIQDSGEENASHLSAITALSLGQVQSKYIKDLLLNHLRDKSISLLECAILSEYEDQGINTLLIRHCFSANKSRDKCCFLACLSEVDSDLRDSEVDAMLHQYKLFPIEIAYILCSNIMATRRNLCHTVYKIFSDESAPMSVRCAAIENFIKMNKGDTELLLQVLRVMQTSAIDEYLLIAINLLSSVNSLEFVDGIFKMTLNNTTSDIVVCSMVRYLSSNTVESDVVGEWLAFHIDNWKDNADIYLLFLLALARHNDYFVYQRIVQYYATVSSDFELIAICKALTYMNSEEATDRLLSILNVQTDISVISSIINMMGTLNYPIIEDVFVRYLDVSQWPPSWPAPLPSLERGEQRPTDSRKLNLIIALNRKRSHNALPILLEIINDNMESESIRRAARIAVTNLQWETRMF